MRPLRASRSGAGHSGLGTCVDCIALKRKEKSMPMGNHKERPQQRSCLDLCIIAPVSVNQTQLLQETTWQLPWWMMQPALQSCCHGIGRTSGSWALARPSGSGTCRGCRQQTSYSSRGGPRPANLQACLSITYPRRLVPVSPITACHTHSA